ncbi:MAG: toll/interleukin-1 receptor domain-containing protein [Chitinophagales bacterium]
MSKKAVKIFLAYAQADDALKDELLKHFALLRRRKVIEIWDMEQLVAGQETETVIKQHLEASQIIMILLSSDFIASDFCYKIELMAMEYYEKAVVKPLFVPVLLRPCDILPFYEQLKIVPSQTHAITDLHWHNKDKAFDIVKNEIEYLVRKSQQNTETKVAKSEEKRAKKVEAVQTPHYVLEQQKTGKQPIKDEYNSQNIKVVELQQIINIPTYASLHTPLGINGNVLVPNVDKWLALVDKYLNILEKKNQTALSFEMVSISKATLLLKKASLWQAKVVGELAKKSTEIETKKQKEISLATLWEGFTSVTDTLTSSKKAEVYLGQAYQLAPQDLDIMLEAIHLLPLSTPFDTSDEMNFLNQMYHFFQQKPPQTHKERFIHAQMYLSLAQMTNSYNVQDRLNMCNYSLQTFQVLEEAYYLFEAKKLLKNLTEEQQQAGFANFFSNAFSNNGQNIAFEALGKWHIQAHLPSAAIYQLNLQGNGFFVGKKYEYLGKEIAIQGRWQFQNDFLTIENAVSLKLENIQENEVWKAFDNEKIAYNLYKMS